MSRAILTAFLIATAVPALADEPKVSITIRDDGFAPAEVQVPTGTKIELSITQRAEKRGRVRKQGAAPRKGDPAGRDRRRVYVGPLQPGRYEFFDDFHPTNRGFLVAK